MTNARKLVIVESPAKARVISSYLGPEFDVEASIGHIRDLPQPSELPKEMKKGPFGKFAVDVDNGFEPYYVVDADKRKKVTELRAKLKSADELFLATDVDREGEAIAWHLHEVLKPKVPVRRMVFQEITKEAIERAMANTRDLDLRLVDAQETRRILDRLYGYEVSPVLYGAKCGRACPLAGCNLLPPGWSSTGSGTGLLSSPPPTGTSSASSSPLMTGRSRPDSSVWMVPASLPDGISTTKAS
jgi:DNA topoisomerase IA